MTTNKREYVGNSLPFAKEGIWQFTLRELQGVFSNPRFWIGFVAVVAILVAMGPFGTAEEMTLPERIVYWAFTGIVSFGLGATISMTAGLKVYAIQGSEWFGRIMGGVIAGPPLGAFIWLTNQYLFGQDMGSWSVFARVCVYTTTISVAVSVLYFLISVEIRKGEATDTSSRSDDTQPFFKRLPRPLGTELISISAQDHYLEVVTTTGRDLILLRLSDAVEELSNYDGIQIHRSHWVAKKHISATQTRNGQLSITLSNGSQLPVSRTFKPAVSKLLELQP